MVVIVSGDMTPWKRFKRWAGWQEKTLWHWQELLLFPLAIVLVTVGFTFCQNRRQEAIESQRAKVARELEALSAERANVQAYLEYMGTLLLHEDLRDAGEEDDSRRLARARTLAILDGVTKDRKVRVLEFLDETELIQFRSKGQDPIISLRFANLSGIHLAGRSLLSNTNLHNADLTGTKLTNAKLIGTKLSKADLSGVRLYSTDLSGTDLSDADLSGVKGLTCPQAEQAESLEGATMTNGQTLEEWKDEKECRRPWWRGIF